MSYKCDPCRFRNKRSKATFFCQKCMEYYCKRCRSQHLKFRLTIGHLVTELRHTEEDQSNGKITAHDMDLSRDQNGYSTVTDSDSNPEFYDYDADILETEATRNCHLSGKCVVRVDSCGISLTEVDSHVTMCWPYTCIRKYGSMDGKIFFFESGRRCVTGEGRFVMMTHNAVILHQNMTHFIRRVEKNMQI